MRANKKTELRIDGTLQKIDFIYKLIGVDWERGAEITMKANIYCAVNMINYNLEVLGAVWWLIDAVNMNKELTELTHVAPCATLCALANIKYYCIFIYKHKCIYLLNTLRQFEMKATIEDPEKIEIVETEGKNLQKVFRTSNWIYLMLFTGYFMTPLLQIGYHYTITHKIGLELPLYIKYPFDQFDIRYFPFVYLHQSWSIVLVIVYICGSDYVFYIACTYICVNLRLLHYDIERCISSNHIGSNYQDNLNLEKTLLKLIRRHQEILRCVDLLEEIYSKSTLCNFLASSIVICLTGFNVTAVTNLAFVMTFLSFLAMSVMQIFCLCFYGNMITETSVALSEAVFYCKWYLTNARIGKILLLIQIRSLKRCKLTAYGFADVNLQAFTKILSTSWSYFTLLQTMNSRASV